MRSLPKPVYLYSLGLLTLAITLSLGSTSPWPAPNAQAIEVQGLASVPDLTGTWQGTWTDTRYNVGGAMTMVIALDGNSYSATGTIDISEIDGLLGTLSGSASGTINGNSMDFTFDAAQLGSGSGSFTDGAASGTGTVAAPLNFGGFTFSGTVSGSQMDGAFQFTSPTGGNGTATLSRAIATEDAAWGELKAQYH